MRVDNFPDITIELMKKNEEHIKTIRDTLEILSDGLNYFDRNLLNIVDMAKKRMASLNSLTNEHKEIRDIIGADAGEPLVAAIRAKMNELKELKVELMQREQCEYMELDPDPSAIPIGRLLTDKELRQKIDELASVLDYSNPLEDLKK